MTCFDISKSSPSSSASMLNFEGSLENKLAISEIHHPSGANCMVCSLPSLSSEKERSKPRSTKIMYSQTSPAFNRNCRFRTFFGISFFLMTSKSSSDTLIRERILFSSSICIYCCYLTGISSFLIVGSALCLPLYQQSQVKTYSGSDLRTHSFILVLSPPIQACHLRRS